VGHGGGQAYETFLSEEKAKVIRWFSRVVKPALPDEPVPPFDAVDVETAAVTRRNHHRAPLRLSGSGFLIFSEGDRIEIHRHSQGQIHCLIAPFSFSPYPKRGFVPCSQKADPKKRVASR
jgi:hypothetical protein